MWFLFQDVLIFMANNIPQKYDITSLKSMLKVFYLLKVRFQFDNDEVIDVCIQCNRWNKVVTLQFSETVTIDIFTVFIKAVVFHHVGLLWMIEAKDKYQFSVDDHFIEWCTVGPWLNQIFSKNSMTPHLSNYLSLHVKTYMT